MELNDFRHLNLDKIRQDAVIFFECDGQ